jgi:hypothetical protein
VLGCDPARGTRRARAPGIKKKKNNFQTRPNSTRHFQNEGICVYKKTLSRETMPFQKEKTRAVQILHDIFKPYKEICIKNLLEKPTQNSSSLNTGWVWAGR